MIQIRKLTLISLLIAMSVMGANIKILGSIALDSFPAFIGTALLGPVWGMALAFIGHMLSAYLAGFSYSYPVHLLIGIMMMVTMFAYGLIRKRRIHLEMKTMIFSNVLAYIFNVPVSLMTLIPFYGLAGVLPLVIPLTIATVANLLLTEFVFMSLPETYKKRVATL
ncbi:ECF transporter S component [Facklamia lactis]|uniref:ECF transporter S component n=1 Tax=Facklamia lactis TaxID=2749967 RepID=UPI0018CF5BCF|nr:ECF transporter S component [Facklamia lactis]